MSISAVLGFVALAGLLMLLGGVAIGISNAAQNRSARPGILLAAVGLLVAIIFGSMSSGLVEIGPTEVGVVFHQLGGDPATHSLSPDPLGPGVHIIVPVIDQVFVYSTASQTYIMAKANAEGAIQGDDAVNARTNDGQQTYIDVSVSYNIDPKQVNTVHIKWQDRYTDDFVRVRVRATTYAMIANYAAADVYGGKRAEIQTNLFNQLKPEFEANGLNLSNLSIRNITFTDQFAKSIEDKQVAQQQAEQALQEAARRRTLAQGDADAAVTAADGSAKAEIAQANGDAQAIKLRAAADAAGLDLINQQLSKNPLLVEWRYIEKLAGNVRLVMVPSSSQFLFNPADLIKGSVNGGGVVVTSTVTSATPEPTSTSVP